MILNFTNPEQKMSHFQHKPKYCKRLCVNCSTIASECTFTFAAVKSVKAGLMAVSFDDPIQTDTFIATISPGSEFSPESGLQNGHAMQEKQANSSTDSYKAGVTQNVFNTRYECILTGKVAKPAPKRKYISVFERHAASAAERTAKTIAMRTDGINIPTKEDADRRASFSKASI